MSIRPIIRLNAQYVNDWYNDQLVPVRIHLLCIVIVINTMNVI